MDGHSHWVDGKNNKQHNWGGATQNGKVSIIELYALCKGGNINFHIWAWFSYFIC